MSESERATRSRLLPALLLVVVLTLGASPFASAAPAATLTIDHFDTEQSLSATLNNPASGSVTAQGSDIILGGERDARVTVLSGSPGTTSMAAVNSQLQHNQDSLITGQTLLQWDGQDGSINLNNTGLGGVDLTQGRTENGFAVTVLFNDASIPLVFTVYSGGNASTATLLLPGGQFSGSINYYLPYAAFTTSAGSGADFANVGAIELLIDGANLPGRDLTIEAITTATLDWGDLPDSSVAGTHPNYPTRYADNGPSHLIGNLFLGAAIDSHELDGLPTLNADGDDLDGIDDEDGVVRTPGVLWTSGTGGSVDVTVTGGSGCLSAWIDWNGDGVFTGTGENILNNVAVAVGTTTQTFSIPVDPRTGSFYARFRLYGQDAGGACTSTKAPTGPATNGEVEDYLWGFGPNAVSLSSFGAVASPAAWPVAGGAIASAAVLLAGLRRLLRP